MPAYLDEVLPEDHLARVIWEATGYLDLSGFLEHLVVTEDGPGRAAADPRLPVALWTYATSQGVTSARELDRLCVRDLTYIWLCGGVSMNYHTLSSFRVDYREALDRLMADLLGFPLSPRHRAPCSPAPLLLCPPAPLLPTPLTPSPPCGTLSPR